MKTGLFEQLDDYAEDRPKQYYARMIEHLTEDAYHAAEFMSNHTYAELISWLELLQRYLNQKKSEDDTPQNIPQCYLAERAQAVIDEAGEGWFSRTNTLFSQDENGDYYPIPYTDMLYIAAAEPRRILDLVEKGGSK